MTSKGFVESGISEENIENISEIPQSLLESLECVICLELVKDPMECNGCQQLYCSECWNQLKIAGKGCVMRCTKPVEKANKFVYGILDKLKLKCPICNLGGLNYSKYVLHYDSCIIAQKYGTIEELTKLEEEKDEEIKRLKQKIADAKNNTIQGEQEVKFSQDELRKTLITNKLDINQKMMLYQSAVKGKLEDFKSLIQGGASMLEEVSAANFYWTPLHYAMHYGQMEIVFYILDRLKEQGKYRMAMELESNDNRTPVLCLLKSNALSATDKKEYFTRLVRKYTIYNNDRVMREIKNRNLEEIFNQYQMK